MNVIPTEAEAGFDIRIPPSVNLIEFKKQLDEWTNEAGVTYQFTTTPPMKNTTTSTKDDSYWWNIFKSATEESYALPINHLIGYLLFYF